MGESACAARGPAEEHGGADADAAGSVCFGKQSFMSSLMNVPTSQLTLALVAGEDKQTQGQRDRTVSMPSLEC
jgi:hypothetical protein